MLEEAWLTEQIRPFIEMDTDGIFGKGIYDLDIIVKAGSLSDEWPRGFTLWFGTAAGKSYDTDELLRIPCEGTIEEAKLIQKVVRSFGREVHHTWGQQYSPNP